MSENFAVIDCETTGFGNTDRIIEIAIVVLNSKTLETVDEFDTLINPLRDVGKTDIHGVTATMVSAAPTMDEVIGSIAKKIDNTILVAHSLSFDSRMIANECERFAVKFNKGVGVCTLKLTGEKLSVAALRHKIPLFAHHRALADARATAEIFKIEYEGLLETVAAQISAPGFASTVRTFRRDASDISAVTPLNRLLSRACIPSSAEECIDYFDALDWVLDDAVVTAEEQRFLDSIVSGLNLSRTQVRALHEAYLSSIIAAAERDGVVSSSEKVLMDQIASALGLTSFVVPSQTVLPVAGKLKSGLRICFTGTAQGSDGKSIDRSKLEALAASRGMQPVSGVTHKSCDLLVAADPSSVSGKAKKARDYCIPIMSVLEFLDNCK